MKKIILNFGVVILSLILSACSIFGKSGVENLKYEVIKKSGKIEVRNYKPYIAAKTFVKGDDYKEVQNKAFKILAGYIFGGNKDKKEIAMTAPVLQEKGNTDNQPKDDDSSSGQKIAMTAPVLQEKKANGWSMAFSMPSKYSLEDLPKPNSDKISFEKVPAKKFIAIRFNGISSVKRNKTNTDKLNGWLKENKNYEAVSKPMYAGYNPPWTIPYFRRNEILIEVKISESE